MPRVPLKVSSSTHVTLCQEYLSRSQLWHSCNIMPRVPLKHSSSTHVTSCIQDSTIFSRTPSKLFSKSCMFHTVLRGPTHVWLCIAFSQIMIRGNSMFAFHSQLFGLGAQYASISSLKHLAPTQCASQKHTMPGSATGPARRTIAHSSRW